MKNTNSKLRKTLAIAGIALLVALYVLAFIFALTENPNSMRMFAISIVATVIIPVFLYVINMFLKLAQDKRSLSEDVAAGKYISDTNSKTESNNNVNDSGTSDKSD